MGLCMQDALVGGAASGTEGGAGSGEMGAGLQMADTGVAPEVTEDTLPLPPPRPMLPRPDRWDAEVEEDEEDDDEEEEEPVLETAGGVN